jgi:RNase P subunit RPR2
VTLSPFSIYVPPCCSTCNTPLLRWSWFEWAGEELVYWYCLECDLGGRVPYIFTFKKEELTQKWA